MPSKNRKSISVSAGTYAQLRKFCIARNIPMVRMMEALIKTSIGDGGVTVVPTKLEWSEAKHHWMKLVPSVDVRCNNSI